jgi:hypothetical protein
MMQRARRASLVVVLLLLASVGTASAERAWVLWLHTETATIEPEKSITEDYFRQPEGRARGGDAQPGSDLGDRRHHEVLVASGVPSNAATCFCSATSASARSARFCHRLISRSCSASFLSRGSTTRRAGPRFFGAPANSPRSRAARHVVRCEEYSPSRRSNAPIAPGVLQAPASRTIFRLYSTVNRRRVAFATTSIAGPPRACSNALIALRSCLALDSKRPGGHCLTHIGREGNAARLLLLAIQEDSDRSWRLSHTRSGCRQGVAAGLALGDPLIDRNLLLDCRLGRWLAADL